ncbi:MAG: Asp23/Gls24 family envelope stress response protein [Lentisphaeria bacterium]|nr:Asp23/Gls24 family envelope stress response protein [Lentisphaeria bacterium]
MMKKSTTVKKVPQMRENARFLLGSNTLGEIGITERAVAMIVRNSVGSIPGVARLTGNTLVDNLAELVGSKSIKDRSISIKMDKEGFLNVEVAINIRYGYNLPETAEELQNTIAGDIFSYTGLTVSNVDVIVRDLEEEIREETTPATGDLED